MAHGSGEEGRKVTRGQKSPGSSNRVQARPGAPPPRTASRDTDCHSGGLWFCVTLLHVLGGRGSGRRVSFSPHFAERQQPHKAGGRPCARQRRRGRVGLLTMESHQNSATSPTCMDVSSTSQTSSLNMFPMIMCMGWPTRLLSSITVRSSSHFVVRK